MLSYQHTNIWAPNIDVICIHVWQQFILATCQEMRNTKQLLQYNQVLKGKKQHFGDDKFVSYIVYRTSWYIYFSVSYAMHHVYFAWSLSSKVTRLYLSVVSSLCITLYNCAQDLYFSIRSTI